MPRKPTKKPTMEFMTDEPAMMTPSPMAPAPKMAKESIPNHPGHEVHVMYMIMTSFLISLVVGGVVWFALDARVSSIERSARIQQSVLNSIVNP